MFVFARVVTRAPASSTPVAYIFCGPTPNALPGGRTFENWNGRCRSAVAAGARPVRDPASLSRDAAPPCVLFAAARLGRDRRHTVRADTARECEPALPGS